MNIYFSGIGGVGLGPLAEIAYDAGYHVQGSDLHAGLITAELQTRGISIDFNQDGIFLRSCHTTNPIDWFIHTAALPTDNPELLLAKELGIKTAKRDELLAHIITEKQLKLIAVAGSHGKTTTTGMLAWAMKELGIPVSYSVGTTLSFGPSGKFNPHSEYFLYECDEFDRNFLHFTPYLSLVTSIDYDHPDTYKTETDYMNAFRQFVDQSDMAIMWQQDGQKIHATADDGWILRNDEVMDIKLPGAHYRRNGTLVAKALEYLKISDPRAITNILNNFPGTDRRFERLADNLYTDYGHHPTEIAAMLQLAHEISEHIVLVYQPHQNVRQHEVKDDYTDCFNLAEEIYWVPTYLSREDPMLPILTPEELTQNITNRQAIHIAELDDNLWNNINEARQSGKLVLAMGAGNIDGWLRNKLSV